jgi:hypothetical protein
LSFGSTIREVSCCFRRILRAHWRGKAAAIYILLPLPAWLQGRVGSSGREELVPY